MRVIAGSAKGTRLAPVPSGTRPLSDRAREGLFSSLGPLLPAAAVLDLYAGTGALGIEALSRGADRAVFVDRADAAIRTIRENLARAKVGDRAVVEQATAARFLRRPGPERFGLVLADPPHATEITEISEMLGLLGPHLAPEATIALTRSKRSDIDVIPLDFRVDKTLAYGDSVVHLIREDPRARERRMSGDL